MVTSSGDAVIFIVAAALTFLGFICQLASSSFVSRQRKVIRRLRQQWPTTSLVEWQNEPAAALNHCGIGSDTLTGSHVLLASKSFTTRNPPSASDLLAVTEDSVRSRIFHTLPNALLSILLILGLAGTIYILREVLQGPQFERIISNDAALSTEQLQTAVKGIYGGFGHAFIFSLCGIGGTIILVLSRALIVRPAELRFFADLQRLTVEFLQPTFQREELTLPEALEQAARLSQTTSETFAQCVEQLTGTFESAAGATAKLGDNVTKLAGFASMMGKAGKALERATIALDESFSEDGRLTRVFTSQEKASASLTEAVEAAVSGLNTHSQNIGNVQRWLGRIGELLEKEIGANDRDRDRQFAALQRIEPLIKTTDLVSSKLTELSQAVHPLTKSPDIVSAKLVELSDELAAVRKSVADSDVHAQNTRAALLREIKAVGNQIAAIPPREVSPRAKPLNEPAPVRLFPGEHGIDYPTEKAKTGPSAHSSSLPSGEIASPKFGAPSGSQHDPLRQPPGRERALTAQSVDANGHPVRKRRWMNLSIPSFLHWKKSTK